jgi:hypothetical protein
MNATTEEQQHKIDSPCASGIVRFRTIRSSYCLVMLTALIAGGCASEHSTQASFADNFRPLVISDVQSFLYLEPSTQTRVPQVRGSLRNLGNQTLIMVEFTLSFKNRRNQIIFEETAYPIYISSLSHAQGSKALAPGQQVKFAFKSPACPKDWQPGQVDVRVTKVVASNL